MKKQYDNKEHAQYIFENDLSGFFNWLAITGKAEETITDYFFDTNQNKNIAMCGALVRHNKWMRYVFEALERGHLLTWGKLEEYAQWCYDTAMENLAVDKFERDNL